MRKLSASRMMLAMGIGLVLALALVGCAAPMANLTPVPTPTPTLEDRLYEAAKKEGKIVWWEHRSLKEAGIWIGAFEKRYPGVKVDYWEATEDMLEKKFLREHDAGKTSVDVLIFGNYVEVKDKGIPSELGDLIKDTNYLEKLATPDMGGVQLEFSVWGVAYNTNLMSEADAPRTWEALLDPKYKGLAQESRVKTYIYGTDLPEYHGRYPGLWSEDWVVDHLTKMRAQAPRFEVQVTATMTHLAAGKFPMAVGVYLHRTLMMKADGAPVEWAPMDKAIVTPASTYIIPKDAPHPNAARLFLRWMMGPEGADLIEQVRHKSNPMPGSGTIPSQYLEKLGTKPVVGGLEIEDHFKRLEAKYMEALGVPK